MRVSDVIEGDIALMTKKEAKSKGANMARWEDRVREFMITGEYAERIENGEITKEQVIEIVSGLPEKPKPSFWTSRDRMKPFYNKLKKMGFSFSGTGRYGSVWVRGDRAVKVMNSKDTCYLSYAQYCMKNWENSEHLPRIFNVLTNPQFTIVYTEVLRHLDEKEYRANAGMIYYLDYLNDWEPKGITKKEREHRTFEAKRFIQENPKFVGAVNHIIKSLKQAKCNIDLHANNVMIRPSSGVIVITDPLATIL